MYSTDQIKTMAKHTDNPEEGDNVNEENNGDDNFGLPDLDYKPLDSNEETSSTTTRYSAEENVAVWKDLIINFDFKLYLANVINCRLLRNKSINFWSLSRLEPGTIRS